MKSYNLCHILSITAFFLITLCACNSLNEKKQDKLLNWIENKIEKTYIQINDEIKNCSFKNKWTK